MYRRQVGEQTLTFGVSGMLYNSALLMYDHQTRSVWSHITGEALAGPLKGERLERIVAVPQISWGAIAEEAPDAEVLSVDGFESPDGDSYGAYHASATDIGMGPLPPLDDRLPGKTRVIGILVDGQALAIPPQALSEEGVRHVSLGGRDLVAARSGRRRFRIVYSRSVKGQVLTFAPELVNGRLRDTTTGTTWNLVHGTGVAGPLADEKLEPVPFVNIYWFAWAAYYPDTEVLMP